MENKMAMDKIDQPHRTAAHMHSAWTGRQRCLNSSSAMSATSGMSRCRTWRSSSSATAARSLWERLG